MLKLMQKERYIRRNPPEIAISHLDLFLKRLLELKNIIMEKINNIENIKTDGNNINVENNYKNKNDNKDDNNESNEDEKNEIKRNESPKRIKNTASVLFDFNKKILVSDFGKSFKKKKLKSLSPINYKRFQTISNSKRTNNNSSIKEFFSLIIKFKKNVKDKNKLLREVQKQSRKFLIREKIELKQIQMNLNKLKAKDEYNDFSNLFAKNPNAKKSILDKFKRKKGEDNVLDPILNDIKNSIKNNKNLDSIIMKNENKNNRNVTLNKSFDKLFNDFEYNNNINFNSIYDKEKDNKIFLINRKNKNKKLNDIKIKTKTSISCNTKKLNTPYKSTDYSSTNQISTSYSKNYNLTNINLNDINNFNTNTNYFDNKYNSQDLYYMLYLKYISDKLKNKNSNNNDNLLFEERFKTLNNENYFINRVNNQKREEIIIPYIKNSMNK
jgi:hypothetical protein